MLRILELCYVRLDLDLDLDGLVGGVGEYELLLVAAYLLYWGYDR